MKIFIFIEHDIIIRHFLHNDTFKELANKHNVSFVFPKEGLNRLKIDINSLNLFNSDVYRIGINQKRISIFKHLFRVEKLKYKKNTNDKKLRNIHFTMLDWKSRILFTIYGLPLINSIYKILKKFQLSFIYKNTAIVNFIKMNKPDMIIHPSVLEGLFINDLAIITEEYKIPFITIMNSWDNPSTKFNIVGKLDWLLVWGEQTKKHSEMFINMDKRKIINFGAAQFEVYNTIPKKDKNKLIIEYDIPISNQILLYAGSSKGVDEYQHLKNLDDCIINNKIKNLSIIYRPHPWGKGGKNGHKILKHKWQNVIIEKNMLFYLKNLNLFKNKIYLPDYNDTRDLLNSIDFIVSPLSTIILEAGIMGKPAICFVPNDENDAKHLNLTKNLTHFEDMYKLKTFYKVEYFEDLLETINFIIKNKKSTYFKNELKKDIEYFVKNYEIPYNLRLLNFCEEIIYSNR